MSARFVLLLAAFVPMSSSVMAGGLMLGELCRVKGQETNTVQGLGLVVGLRGTGDGEAAPTSRSLARMMQLMGGQMRLDAAGRLDLTDVADAKNVAMVFVTAQLPSVGAQQGDFVDVTVNAISAKSLEGGTLMLTPMLGPLPVNQTIYGMSQGRLVVSPDGPATTATIRGGMKMEANVLAEYVEDNQITLILDSDFADFNTIYVIEDEINNFIRLERRELANSRLSSGAYGSNTPAKYARAVDQLHVEVQIPDVYQDAPVKFLSFLLGGVRIQLPNRSKRVVINETDGVVLIGDDVEFAPGLVNFRNYRIQAVGPTGFVELAPDGSPSAARLKSLADALGALGAPTDDLIAIIKTLKAKGDLYGEVIYR